jgi:hypothetical protein
MLLHLKCTHGAHGGLQHAISDAHGETPGSFSTVGLALAC